MRALLISANVFVVLTKVHFLLLVKYNIQSIAFSIHPMVSCMGFDKELFLITVITYLDRRVFMSGILKFNYFLMEEDSPAVDREVEVHRTK